MSVKFLFHLFMHSFTREILISSGNLVIEYYNETKNAELFNLLKVQTG